MCCDSAHKTLPCLTGGAYLHVAEKAKIYCKNAREHLSLFASTSPSYLILQSLDLCNSYINENYPQKLSQTRKKISELKKELRSNGFELSGNEPLKIIIDCNKYGYDGRKVHEYLFAEGVSCEYSDRQYIVLMFSAQNSNEDYSKLTKTLLSLKKMPSIKNEAPFMPKETVALTTPRRALFSKRETLPVSDAENRICADPSVACPPAVPIVTSGELITKEHIKLMYYYGIERISVIM